MSVVVENVTFQSEGFDLTGRLYHPAPDGKYPAIAILNGFPGDVKNMDLAEELAFKGAVVLLFYYQGAWGSKGVFRFTKMETNTRAALKYIRGLSYVAPDRVSLIAHSMGAIPLLKQLSVDPHLKAGALLAPVTDVGPWASSDMIEAVIPHFIQSGRGKTEGMTSEQLRADLKELAQTQNPLDVVQLVKAPLLVVVGGGDEASTPELCRKFFEKAREPKKWVLIEKADHTFSEYRLQLIQSVVGWMMGILMV